MDPARKNDDSFPLMVLTIKLLRKFRFWNDTPGQRFPSVGAFILALYPLLWLIPSIMFLLTSEATVTQRLKAGNEQIVFVAIFFKLFSFARNFQRWEKLFYELQRAYNSVIGDADPRVQLILAYVVKSTHYLTKYYSSLILFNCGVYGAVPMLIVIIKYAVTGSYTVPLATPIESNYYVPGYRTKFWVWIWMEIFLNFMLELHGIIVFAVECFMWNVVHTSVCLLRILRIKAEDLLEQDGAGTWPTKIGNFVRLHDSALRMCKELEDLLSGQILFLYMSTIFALCLTMIVVSVAFHDFHLLVTLICVFGYCLFQTFSFSFLGTELIEKSVAIADAIFHSQWSSLDAPKQHDLRFIVMRAQKPVKLTAAKLFIVTRDSFTEVIRQAYTIFTLMSQFLDGTVD